MKKILASLVCLFITAAAWACEGDECPILYKCTAYIERTVTLYSSDGEEKFSSRIEKNSGQAGRNIRHEIFQAFQDFKYDVVGACNAEDAIPQNPPSNKEWKWDEVTCGYTCETDSL